ncbi:MAG: tetratricopeptide repeat protein [Elusimicrobiota bacterium]|nr:MAG: tetratricopeptide repeat protein [Elusimicrobiota bacterium]
MRGNSTLAADQATPQASAAGSLVAAGAQAAAAAARTAAAGTQSVAPTAQAAAAKPQAVAAKLAIRDALTRGDAPAAERLFAEALANFPNDPDLRQVRDRQMLRLHDEKIRGIFDRTLTDSRKLFGRQWLPGQSIEEDEWSIELAKERSGGARPLKPGPGVRTALDNGYALLDRGDPVQAEQVLSGAIRKNSDSAPLYYARVMARGMSGNLKGADEDSLKAVALSREQSETLSQRALLMMQARRRGEAFAWADRALKSDPGDADALAIRGRVLWSDRGRYELALEDLKQAALISPERYRNLYQEAQKRFYGHRALSGLGKGDDKQALEDADRALASNAGDATAHMVRGAVFSRAGKVEEAIKETTLALKADSRSAEALLYRGMAMETLGQRGRALADFKRAADIDPVRFRRFYERLVQAQREGAPPLWSRKGGAVTASN